MIKKIFWLVLVLTIVVWLGVGIYYLKPIPTSQAPPSPSVRETIPPPQPTQPVVSENLDEVEFVVGHFENWEEIPGSSDRYILLTATDSGQLLPKIRVGFEFSELFGYEGKKDITVFAVEKSDKEYDVLWALKYFTEEEINKIIKKGDWIKIYLKRKMEREENLKDEAGKPLAHWLFIKRAGGKGEVEKELGREIKKPEINE